jgi:membrane protein implicated in regulation of membrane protease activity
VLIAGIPLIGSEFAITICFIVAILTLIIAWLAAQARQWWWTVVMAAIAVLWNPVFLRLHRRAVARRTHRRLRPVRRRGRAHLRPPRGDRCGARLSLVGARRSPLGDWMP